ncbi:hypothetical protein IW261DRAFT_1518270 [Armillaria novae-zelandiae]|uniref:Protein MON2 homolog n=1 Tax=Armillaria novae-zelandiae TaxID=153914 RepID=A0AA39NN67_9AGAR|nr:hypothetical protein IW261DRAFT_1518270 [Armillaria novae-zelandiae]
MAQSLASETRRKHPDIREAAEKSLAILRASPEQATASLASDGPQSDDLLRPVFMGCATRNAKVVAISLGSLQRLIALKAVPQSAVALIISTMSDAISQGVDIQLRILQTLLSLITNFPAVHGPMLGDALLLCFKLQESKIAVVSSTAAATLRQLVMFVVDKMVDEDRKDDVSADEMSEVKLPDGTTKTLGPSARDAFAVFEDLCLLANAEKPHFLKLDFLHKTFALELIESVLTNYHDLFRRHAEMTLLLRHHLCPLLLKAISERPIFPLTLRCTRVIFLLLKQFSLELQTESEVFLMLFIKIITEDPEAPQWMRVLAMEIMRGLCSDAELMRNVWDRYDAQGAGSKVFTSLVSALNRLVTEKPALLGVGTQMSGVGVHSESGSLSASSSGYSLDMGGMAAIASATVSGVVGMMGTSGGLSLQGSAMKLQCIDQLDKADSPPIPESYIYLLGIQCLVSLCEGFASFTGPLYTSIVIQKPRAAGEAVNRAPPALDLSTLPADDITTKHLHIVRDIIESGWPALLAALSFVISTNLSDELFADVLASYQAVTNVSGMLGLTTSRDAFFTSLSKFSVPSRVVHSLDTYTDVQTPRSAGGSLSENLGFTGPSGPPGLSERNLACLKVLLSSAMFLAGSLGGSWFQILEVLQNAEYVLTWKGGPQGTPSKRLPFGHTQAGRSMSVSGAPPVPHPALPRHPILSDLDSETLQNGIQRLFDASKNLDDVAFKYFIDALCRLSAEMVDMQSDGGNIILETDSVEELSSVGLSPVLDASSRRRISGIHIPRSVRSGDFGIGKLGGIARLNIHRLIYRSPDVAWDKTTSHLLSIIRLQFAPQAIRIQAARVLDDILETVPRNLSATAELQAPVQKRVLDVLVELRKMGLETLHQILQSIIFAMLGSVCKPPPMTRSSSIDSVTALSAASSPTVRSKPKSNNALIKIAFQVPNPCLRFRDSPSPLTILRLCISTLGQFGKQSDTNIALTAACHQNGNTAEKEPEYSALWMFLLLEVLGLCTDPRPEVRDGAIQTLFRTMQLYGGTLSLETWDQCIWKVTFPLLDSLSEELRRHSSEEEGVSPSDQAWDASKILALQSIGRFSFDHRTISAPALRCLEKALKASSSASPEVKERVSDVWERVWQSGSQTPSKPFVEGGPPKPFTQESLVAVVDVIQATRAVSRVVSGTEWPLDRITRLMGILKGVLTYPSSPDYRPDIDALPPLQSVVMETISAIDLSVTGSPSLIMRDLSEFATLAFLAAFDVQMSSGSQIPQKRITYIALSKRTMPMLVDLFTKYKDLVAIYVDGTLEAVLSAYSIPIKLKYDCPPASKFGKDLPLWKTATTCFLRIVKELSHQINALSSDIPDERIEGIWRQVIDVFRGGILADCSPAEEFPLDVQEAEENFDLALVAALEIDVVPHFGDPRLPDSLVSQLAKILHRGSLLYESDAGPTSPRSPSPEGAVKTVSPNTAEFVNVNIGHGSTDSGFLLPRERFSYWCFDLLFLICSDTTKDQERSRKRLAALSIPSLLNRCRATLVGYVADEALRGNLPFPRAREDELLYALRKMLELKLWSGSLWAALSEDPSKNCVDQPALDVSLTPSLLIADAVKRSSVAHLFHFYGVLCEIASIPRKTPSTWAISPSTAGISPLNGHTEIINGAVQLDARDLSRQCLKEVGKEMGVSY